MNTIKFPEVSVEKTTAKRSEELSGERAPAKIDLQEFLQILARHKKLVFATTFLVVLLAFSVVVSLTPRYTATALVEISSRQTRVVDFDSVLSGLPYNQETMQTEIAIIESRKLARRAIERLDLQLNPEFNPTLRPSSLFISWRRSVADWLVAHSAASSEGEQGESGRESEKPVGLIDQTLGAMAGLLSPTAATDGDNEDIDTIEINLVIDNFLEKLSVEPEGRSRIVRISFKSESRATAAAAANAVADVYILAQLEAKFDATKRATEWLNERVSELREELTLKERNIEKYRADSGLLQGGDQATLASEEISDLNSQYVLEVARLAESQARLRQANKLLASPGGIESSVDVLQSDLIRELRSQEALLERRIAELSEEYGDSHPTLINARAELKDLKTKINLEVNRIIQGLQNEVAVAEARVASLAAALENHKKKIAKLNQSQVELRALELDANTSRTLLQTLLERTKETTSQESFQEADANIISQASKPVDPSFPPKLLILLMAMIVGAALGILLAFGLEHLDAGFRSGEEISRILGVKSLGMLPRVSKITSAGKPPHDYILKNPNSAFGLAIRSLYTNLLLSDVNRRPRVLMMASALPSEGKTTVTVSLARSLAMNGHRVVVVDCDLWNPTLHKMLEVEPGAGLIECLTSGIAISDAIQVDKASGIHVIQAGNTALSKANQLGSDLMESLLRQLSREYDLVLLDSAPLLAVSESLLLARLADKVVFLVQWAKTRRAIAQMSLKQALDAQAEVAGVTLTMVDVKSHATYGFGDSGVYQGEFRKYYTG